MAGKLEKLNKKLEPYYALFTMIIFFAGLMIGAYNYLIDPSDLKLTIQDESISYPSSVSNAVEKVYSSAMNSDSSKVAAAAIYSFLVHTTGHKKLILSNNSSKTLRGVKFKYLNVDHLTAYGVSAGFLTTKENNKMIEALQYDEQSKIAYLPENIELPANSEIVIELWGSFKSQILNDDIVVSYDEGEASIQRTYTIDGLKGYLINYYFEFILLTLLIFSVCYMVGIQQIKKRYANQEAAVQSN